MVALKLFLMPLGSILIIIGVVLSFSFGLLACTQSSSNECDESILNPFLLLGNVVYLGLAYSGK
ncbi:MAG: hypothetical protein EA343_01975 [Nodularia sp. (in: Bacteria)]|nr:MAG: hypothetical protein EA343_01975 [Nodularia sp. (in: cyanobacteria)]